MRKRTEAGGDTFAEHLARLIAGSQHETSTALARAAGIQPSTVRRWLSGETRPDLAALQAVAPHLGVTVHHLVGLAYPDDEGEAQLALARAAWEAARITRPESTAPAPPLAAEVQELLTELPAGERARLETVLDAVLEPYRRSVQERAS